MVVVKKVTLSRDEVEAWKRPERLVPWAELHHNRHVRLSDDSVWYVQKFSPDRSQLKMFKTLGGDVYQGPVPDGDARMIVRHDSEWLDEKGEVAPWRFVELPHGTEGNRRHLLTMHGEYMETFQTWQFMTKQHIWMHLTMVGGNGWVPHTHKEPVQIVWK